MGGQFKDASAQNGCRAIYLLLEKTTGCQVPLNIHPSIRPSIHPSIYLSISLSLYRTPQIGGVGGTRALAHSINYIILYHIISYYIVLYHIISYLSQKKTQCSCAINISNFTATPASTAAAVRAGLAMVLQNGASERLNAGRKLPGGVNEMRLSCKMFEDV